MAAFTMNNLTDEEFQIIESGIKAYIKGCDTIREMEAAIALYRKIGDALDD